MKSISKKILIAAAVIVGIALIFLCTYLVRVRLYKDNIKNIQIQEVDFSQVPDGSYMGEYDADFVGAKVIVTVKGGRITNIQLTEHKNERGTPAEVITEDIINEQRLNADSITGATNSSMVIKKAVENALINRKAP